MAKGTSKLAIPDEIITNKIYLVRDKKVMLDEDLAELYGVTTGNLNKAVSRNIARFPDDFMFQLTKEEFDNLFFQTGTSSWGGRRKPPSAFTEQGVAMLSGILHSERAIKVVTLYKQKNSINFIEETQNISRSTIYQYLRNEGVVIKGFKKVKNN